MILITKPFLPPREEYEYYLAGIWNRNWLTSHGPLVILKLKYLPANIWQIKSANIIFHQYATFKFLYKGIFSGVLFVGKE